MKSTASKFVLGIVGFENRVELYDDNDTIFNFR